jgi:menaquinone-9 beta-reductase
MTNPTSSQSHDVTVIGGGLAGKAASIHLAQAGFKVICIEPKDSMVQSVGESLDWSAPDLLSGLGLPMEQLVDSRIATWKRHVTLKLRDGCSEQYVPSAWLGEKPFRVELRTMHVDRLKLDQELLQRVQKQRVELLRDKVVRAESDGKRICSVVTAGGRRFTSQWFIDACGLGASLIAREFNIPAVTSGPPKVALWSYFSVDESVEGTTLYMDPTHADYLDWIWEIPIQPDVVSVGYVLTGAAMKAMHAKGQTNEDIFRHQLAKFPRFEPFLKTAGTGKLNVTSFRCRAHVKTAGPNWVMVGEAASMVDPITSNGVTAALRHAAEASSMIQKFRSRGALPRRERSLYSARVIMVAKFFNDGIEKIVYEPSVRNRISLARAGTIYTGPAWSMNAVYARIKPKGLLSTGFLGLVLGIFRASAWAFYQFCKMAQGRNTQLTRLKSTH